MTNPPHIIQSAIDGETPILWQDMTPEQKGALLLAHHEGKEIERHYFDGWRSVKDIGYKGIAYRAKPAPKTTEHVLYWVRGSDATTFIGDKDTHRLTIRHTGDTLPYGTYTGPDGATITVEKAE